LPTRFSPRCFTCAIAARVRSLVSPASNSATAAIIVRKNLVLRSLAEELDALKIETVRPVDAS
jgi:hypothetical protein